MGINVLSLFDGCSCGRVALEKLGIKVDKYYSSEIEKHAIAITQHNFPDTIQLGDITKWREWNIDFSTIDILFAGFCCQSWSMSGKQLGDKDPRGKLMWDMLDILKHIRKLNPNIKFLFENVRMKKEFKDYIDAAIGCEGILINSALLSAQNRNRNYWTNIPIKGLPEDKNIYLKDIIENNIDNSLYCINKDGTEKIKSNTIRTSSMGAGIDNKHNWDSIRIGQIGNGGQGQRIYSTEGKSVPLCALGGGQGAKTGLYAIAQRGRNIVDGKRQDIYGAKTQQRFETTYSEKCNTLTTVQKDSLLLDVRNGNYIIRKLTCIECERLQTLYDNYTKYGNYNGVIKEVAKTNRYKALGNGWTVDVIVWILGFLKNS